MVDSRCCWLMMRWTLPSALFALVWCLAVFRWWWCVRAFTTHLFPPRFLPLRAGWEKTNKQSTKPLWISSWMRACKQKSLNEKRFLCRSLSPPRSASLCVLPLLKSVLVRVDLMAVWVRESASCVCVGGEIRSFQKVRRRPCGWLGIVYLSLGVEKVSFLVVLQMSLHSLSFLFRKYGYGKRE